MPQYMFFITLPQNTALLGGGISGSWINGTNYVSAEFFLYENFAESGCHQYPVKTNNVSDPQAMLNIDQIAERKKGISSMSAEFSKCG